MFVKDLIHYDNFKIVIGNTPIEYTFMEDEKCK